MRVLGSSGFNVYIYDNDHPPPHCHVVYSNNEKTIVGLPLLQVIYGKPLKKTVRKYLEDNIDALADIWELKHPK